MAGFKDASTFLNDITEQQAQMLAQQDQPKVDPSVQAAQEIAQVEREKAQLKAQTEMAKLELDRQQMELDNARKQLELQIQEFKIQADAQNASEKAKADSMRSVMASLKDIKDLQNPFNA